MNASCAEHKQCMFCAKMFINQLFLHQHVIKYHGLDAEQYKMLEDEVHEWVPPQMTKEEEEELILRQHKIAREQEWMQNHQSSQLQQAKQACSLYGYQCIKEIAGAKIFYELVHTPYNSLPHVNDYEKELNTVI